MKKILVVDDSATMRRMVKTCLRGLQDVQVEEADSGFEAIERLAQGPVDLIILDLNMPDMHGFEVLEFLRKHPPFNGIRVLVLTTVGDEASRSQAFAKGATDYMTKPFDPGVLVERAAKLLTEREYD